MTSMTTAFRRARLAAALNLLATGLGFQTVFEGLTGVGLGEPGEPQVCGRLADQCGGDDPREPSRFEDHADLGLDLLAGLAGLAPGEAGGEL
jgi:hypothetical protein